MRIDAIFDLRSSVLGSRFLVLYIRRTFRMAYQPAQVAPEPQGRLAYKWKVLISVVFGIFMIILDTTVVNVAFQTIRVEYNTSLNNSQWIISIYVLALGIGTPMSGYLA